MISFLHIRSLKQFDLLQYKISKKDLISCNIKSQNTIYLLQYRVIENNLIFCNT